LLGKHDFSTFRASLCQAQSPIKTLDRLSIHRVGEEIQVIVEARSFLHHQVRNFVGTLRLVGEGKWSKDDVKAALEAKDRAKGGPTAPPDGLYLTRVSY
jgi:tRNA pseudouridine38-40 synthase